MCVCARERTGLISYYGTQSYKNIPGIYQIFVTEPDARLCKLVRDCEAGKTLHTIHRQTNFAGQPLERVMSSVGEASSGVTGAFLVVEVQYSN